MTQIGDVDLRERLNLTGIYDVHEANIVSSVKTYNDYKNSKDFEDNNNSLRDLVIKIENILKEATSIQDTIDICNKHLNKFKIGITLSNILEIFRCKKNNGPTTLEEIAKWITSNDFINERPPFYRRAGLKFKTMVTFLVFLESLGYLTHLQYLNALLRIDEVTDQITGKKEQ